jgi:short-subunit dehydrogenase
VARIELTNRPIVITGASSGIGRATAIACARAGMPVALAARRTDLLERTRDEIRAAGGTAVALPCDVSDERQCKALIDRAEAELGPLHAVFANAGYGMETPTLSHADADADAMFRTNFMGTLWTIRPAIERMRARREGHILICSSCLAKIGTPFHAAYSASKACQDHYARALRLELRSEGIHVSGVYPIGTSTEFFDAASARSPSYQGLAPRTAAPLMQPPERVARAIVRCLQRPKGEVWTSTPTRLALALSVALPGVADLVLARMIRRRAGRAQSEG